MNNALTKSNIRVTYQLIKHKKLNCLICRYDTTHCTLYHWHVINSWLKTVDFYGIPSVQLYCWYPLPIIWKQTIQHNYLSMSNPGHATSKIGHTHYIMDQPYTLRYEFYLNNTIFIIETKQQARSVPPAQNHWHMHPCYIPSIRDNTTAANQNSAVLAMDNVAEEFQTRVETSPTITVPLYSVISWGPPMYVFGSFWFIL